MVVLGGTIDALSHILKCMAMLEKPAGTHLTRLVCRLRPRQPVRNRRWSRSNTYASLMALSRQSRGSKLCRCRAARSPLRFSNPLVPRHGCRRRGCTFRPGPRLWVRAQTVGPSTCSRYRSTAMTRTRACHSRARLPCSRRRVLCRAIRAPSHSRQCRWHSLRRRHRSRRAVP